MMRSVRLLSLVALALCLLAPRVGGAAEMPDLYFVDAHSQLPKGQDPDEIISLMDQAGVWRTILSARNDRTPKDVAELANTHPNRITAAVRSKGKAFNNNTGKYKKIIMKQVKNPIFSAMAEAILYHAQKGKKAPKIEVSINEPQAQLLLDIALKKKWPFVAHYEFKAAGWDKEKFMKEFEAAASAHPNHPFMLIHMGQLQADEAARLITAHPNVYFMMSHSNPVTRANTNQPWANLFEGKKLAPKWLALMTANPQRFVLTFDNVWPEDWGDKYLKQAKLWRQVLSALPSELAHAMAHGNAERLWTLKPH